MNDVGGGAGFGIFELKDVGGGAGFGKFELKDVGGGAGFGLCVYRYDVGSDCGDCVVVAYCDEEAGGGAIWFWPFWEGGGAASGFLEVREDADGLGESDEGAGGAEIRLGESEEVGGGTEIRLGESDEGAGGIGLGESDEVGRDAGIGLGEREEGAVGSAV